MTVLTLPQPDDGEHAGEPHEPPEDLHHLDDHDLDVGGLHDLGDLHDLGQLGDGRRLPEHGHPGGGGVGGRRRPEWDDVLPPAVAAALARVAAGGFAGRFVVETESLWCGGCRSRLASNDVRWSKVELVNLGAEMAVVGGIACPVYTQRGTAWTTMPTGPAARGRPAGGGRPARDDA